MIDVKVGAEEINVAERIMRVMSPDCGGIVVFVGTVRDNYEGRKVRSVEIEAYDALAVQDLERIAADVRSAFGVRKISIQHRTGKLDVGEVIVVIAVSAPHRKEAFEACREIIERLKKTTPIWKQEFLEDGQCWVGGDRIGSDG